MCPPPNDVLRAEKWAAQMLTRGPWNAIPTDALFELGDLGFDKDFPSLERLGKASALRNVLTSRGFRSSLQGACEEPVGDVNARLAPRRREWHDETTVFFLKRIEDELDHIPQQLADVPRRQLQSKIYMCLREAYGDPCLSLLRRRARRWIEGGFLHVGELAAASCFRDNMRRVCALVPPNVAFSVVRFFCNAFPTSRRFQAEARCCDFCGLEGADGIEHFLSCDRVALFRASTFQYGCVPWDLLFVLPATDKELIGGAVLLDCLLFALRARRINTHGAQGVQILNARYKHLRVRHKSLERGLRAVEVV